MVMSGFARVARACMVPLLRSTWLSMKSNTPVRLHGAVSVAISQSGRSPDIVEMQRAARRGGALAVALVNEVGSPLAKEAGLAVQ